MRGILGAATPAPLDQAVFGREEMQIQLGIVRGVYPAVYVVCPHDFRVTFTPLYIRDPKIFPYPIQATNLALSLS